MPESVPASSSSGRSGWDASAHTRVSEYMPDVPQNRCSVSPRSSEYQTDNPAVPI